MVVQGGGKPAAAITQAQHQGSFTSKLPWECEPVSSEPEPPGCLWYSLWCRGRVGGRRRGDGHTPAHTGPREALSFPKVKRYRPL